MPISEYSTPVQNTLEQYVPMPLQQMYQAAAAIQQRGDLAQGQADQVQTGLSSLEAYAPGHKDFVSKFANDFKTQQAALLDKYHGNTSDVGYGQESRKLNMQFAADPRLQTIKQTNEAWKKKEAIKEELQAKGIKFLDSNPTFTGTDANGNLTSNVGSLNATNFDSNINQAFKDKENAIEQIGHRLTSARNIGRVHSTYVNSDGTLNSNNKDIQEGLSYWKQQGLSDKDAAAKVRNTVDQGLAYSHDIKDHFYEISPYQKEELALEWAKEKDAKAKATADAGPPPFQILHFSKPLTPTGANSQDQKLTTPNSELFNQIQKTRDNLDHGNLKAGERRIEDTEENRKAFGKNATPVQDVVAGSGMGYGSSNYNALSVKDQYDPKEVKLLKTARMVLGIPDKGAPGLSSADQILSKYQDLIKSYDEGSYKVSSTDNKKLNEDMADVARRQIATGEVYKMDKGQLTKVNDEKELGELQTSSSSDNTARDNEVKNIQIAGISPKNLGQLKGGFTQFSNKGKSYYTPLPDEYTKKFEVSKAIENHIQDFDPDNMQSIPSLTDKSANLIINPKDQGHQFEYQGHVGIITPYKTNQNGRLVAGGIFQFRDKDGSVKAAQLPMSVIEDLEKTSIYTESSNHNKVKGN